MPSWKEVLSEIERAASSSRRPEEQVRQNYLRRLYEKTDRNVIAYYSGWVYAGPAYTQFHTVMDGDMNALMACCHRMEHSEGLDLILHTPGGDITATESQVNYLHKMFGRDIRVIVPQLAMSAGTMIACAGKSIVMGKQSSLGPIDPQVAGLPAQLVIKEFRRASEEVRNNPAVAAIWQTIIAQYQPTLLDHCELAIKMAYQMVRQWLAEGMFQGHDDADSMAEHTTKLLSEPDTNHTHSRHLSAEKCKEYGLVVEDLEADQELQDLVLTLHHCYMHSFTQSQGRLVKVTENHLGETFGLSHQ